MTAHVGNPPKESRLLPLWIATKGMGWERSVFPFSVAGHVVLAECNRFVIVCRALAAGVSLAQKSHGKKTLD